VKQKRNSERDYLLSGKEINGSENFEADPSRPSGKGRL